MGGSHGWSSDPVRIALRLPLIIVLAVSPAIAADPPAGVSPDEWASIQQQLEAERHKVTESDRPGRLYRADNPTQRFTADFGAEDVLIEPRGRGEPAWQLGLRLTAWGAAHDLRQVEFAHATAEESLVEYRRGPLTEWYVNSRVGLEQGFTIDVPPDDGIDELVLEMKIDGDLTPVLAENGNAVSFRRSSSTMTLTYSGLAAWDAVDTPIDARMEIRGGGTTLYVVIAVKDAAWPVMLETTIIHVAQLYPAPDLMKTNAGFGQSVAVDGDCLIVGISSREIGGVTGAAHIFRRDEGGTGGWGHVAEIVAEDGQTYDYFGNAVAISGDTVVVGAYGDDDNGPVSGSGYVFRRDHGGPDVWGQVAKVLPADGAAEDFFGTAVAISGDTIVIAAPGDDDNGEYSGSAYVFERNQGGAGSWGQAAKIHPVSGGYMDQFGISAAVSGDTAVIGARYARVAGVPTGAAYIFERDQNGAGAWGQVTEIAAIDGLPGDAFGTSVSIDVDTVVVGSPESNSSGPYSGAGYVFQRDHGGTGNWGQVAKIAASDGAENRWFGHAVAVDGDTTVIGAHGDDHSGSFSGSAYVYQRDHGGPNAWGEVTKITAADGAASDEFGVAVSVSDATAIAGAPNADDDFQNSGASYIFERDQGGPNAWGQVEKIPCPPVFVAEGEYFGSSVSISGDTAVVGAPGDDDYGWHSGSVFVFRRDLRGGGGWGLVTKIIADENTYDDDFGSSVSISGDTVIVGAPDDSAVAPSSGSAFVFQRDQGGVDAWGQVTKITAADGGWSDHLGTAVAIDGDTAIVASPYNDDSGSAYVFERDQGGPDAWGQTAKITSDDGSSGDYFGGSLAICDDSVVVGAPFDDDNGLYSGSAYVFERDQGGPGAWGQVAKLTASGGMPLGRFGASVAIDDDTTVVGAPGSVSSPSGSAYVYRRDAGGPGVWGEVRMITPADGVDEDYFGDSVALHGDTALIGAPGAGAGSAYMFQRDLGGPGDWGQMAKLSGFDAADGDEFGGGVALEADTGIVGARLNDGLGFNSGSASIYRISDAFFVDGFETGDTSGWSVTVP